MESVAARRLIDLALQEGLLDAAQHTAALELLEKRGPEEIERWLADRLPAIRLLTLKSQVAAPTSNRAPTPKAATAVVFAGSPSTAHVERAAPTALGDDCNDESGEPPTPSIPHYRIVREIGRGSAGVVFLAEDQRLRREVAIKIVRGEGWELVGQDLRRFRREAETLAKLRHPGIVQVYEVGDARGAPYLALEYMPGGSLSDLLRTRLPTPRQAARIVGELARAAAFAHRAGVVHRDLKPGNILLDAPAPEPGASPRPIRDPFDVLIPKLSDFGIAKQENSLERTATGMILGTPQYMAPEQASGNAREIGPATDVYGLGGVLYETLTGQPPFVGGSAAAILHQVMTADVVDPQRFDHRVPRDLATICLKCLSKEPKARYATADELADDLERFRNGAAVHARPPSVGEKIWRTVKRRPAAAFAALLLLLIWTVGFPLTFFLWRSAESVKEVAQRRADETQHALGVGHVAQAYTAWRTDDLEAARTFLGLCPEGSRGWGWKYVHGLCERNATSIRIGRGWINSLDYSPDGSLLAVGSGTAHMENNPHPPGFVTLLDARTRTRLHEWEFPRKVVRVGFSASGRRMLVHWEDRLVAIDVQDRRVVRSLQGEGFDCFNVAHDGSVCAFRTKAGAPPQLYEPDADRLRTLAGAEMPRHGELRLSAHGTWLYCIDRDARHCRVFRTADAAPLASWPYFQGDAPHEASAEQDAERHVYFPSATALQQIDVHSGRVEKSWPFRGRAFAGSRDPDFVIAVNGADARAINAKTDGMFHLASPPVMLRQFEFSPNGVWAAELSTSKLVRVFDASDGALLMTCRGHRQPVGCTTFHPHDDLLATGGQDGDVMLWDLRHAPTLTEAETGHGWGDGVAFADLAYTGDGVVALVGQSLRRFDAETLTPFGQTYCDRVFTQRFPATEAAFSDDGARLAVVREDERQTVVAVVDVADPRRPVASYGLGAKVPVRTLAATPNLDRVFWSVTRKLDGERIASTIHCWNPLTNAHSQMDIDDGVPALAPTTDGADLYVVQAVKFDESRVSRWKVAAWEKAWESPRFETFFASLRLSPDGRTLAAADFLDGAVRLFDAADGAVRRTMTGAPQCTGVAFTPDGKELASIGYDGFVQLWDLRSGLLELTLKPNRAARPDDWGANNRLRFTADGRRLVASHWAGAMTSWTVCDDAPKPTSVAARDYWTLCRVLQPEASSAFAKHYYSRLDGARPTEFTVAYLYGIAAYQFGDRDKARETFERLVREGPVRYESFVLRWFSLGPAARARLDCNVEAISTWEKGIVKTLMAYARAPTVEEKIRVCRTRPEMDGFWQAFFDLRGGLDANDRDAVRRAVASLGEGRACAKAVGLAAAAQDSARAGDRATYDKYRRDAEQASKDAVAMGSRRNLTEMGMTIMADDLLREAEEILVAKGLASGAAGR